MEALLRDGARPTGIVVLDECDQLLTKQQELLYRMFSWAADAEVNLCLVGIANGIDFPQRCLQRLGEAGGTPMTMVFRPYGFEQLQSILAARTFGVAHPMAITMCARKCAAATGDARLALDVMRVAVDAALAEQRAAGGEEGAGEGEEHLVRLSPHMTAALSAVDAARPNNAIKCLPPLGQAILTAFAAEIGRETASKRAASGDGDACVEPAMDEGTLRKVYMAACAKAGAPPYSSSEFDGALDFLESGGLVDRAALPTGARGGAGARRSIGLQRQGSVQRDRSVRLVVTVNEVRRSLHDVGHNHRLYQAIAGGAMKM